MRRRRRGRVRRRRRRQPPSARALEARSARSRAGRSGRQGPAVLARRGGTAPVTSCSARSAQALRRPPPREIGRSGNEETPRAFQACAPRSSSPGCSPTRSASSAVFGDQDSRSNPTSTDRSSRAGCRSGHRREKRRDRPRAIGRTAARRARLPKAGQPRAPRSRRPRRRRGHQRARGSSASPASVAESSRVVVVMSLNAQPLFQLGDRARSGRLSDAELPSRS